MIKANYRLLLTTLILIFLATSGLSAQKQMGGLALYTVRNDMETNTKATLQVVAETGYKNIEAAGYKEGQYYGMSPKEFKAYLKQLGLKPISSHQSDVTLDNMNTMFADAKAAGFAKKMMESVRNCVECGECEERCPYGLPIPEMLKRHLALYEQHARGI